MRRRRSSLRGFTAEVDVFERRPYVIVESGVLRRFRMFVTDEEVTRTRNVGGEVLGQTASVSGLEGEARRRRQTPEKREIKYVALERSEG